MGKGMQGMEGEERVGGMEGEERVGERWREGEESLGGGGSEDLGLVLTNSLW